MNHICDDPPPKGIGGWESLPFSKPGILNELDGEYVEVRVVE
jgi:hypothetical protein